MHTYIYVYICISRWRGQSRCTAMPLTPRCPRAGPRCVAACCSVLQRVAACCSVLQCVAACCSVLQRIALLHCVAVCCRCTAIPLSHPRGSQVCCSLLQRVAACCSVSQRVALCCSVAVLQYAAVCRRVLQCVADVLQCRSQVGGSMP